MPEEIRDEVRLPDSKVWVVYSCCRTCKGFMTCAVEHTISRRELRKIGADAAELKMELKRVKLLKWRKNPPTICICKTPEGNFEKKLRRSKKIENILK